MNPAFLAKYLIGVGHKTITEMNTLDEMKRYGPYPNRCHLRHLINLSKGLFCHMLNKVAKLMREGEEHGDILGINCEDCWYRIEELEFSGEIDGRLFTALKNYHSAAGIPMPEVSWKPSITAMRWRMSKRMSKRMPADSDSDSDSDDE